MYFLVLKNDLRNLYRKVNPNLDLRVGFKLEE